MGGGNVNGACNVTFNQVYVGELEKTYKPEGFGLMGPVICQDEFTMKWQSEKFWADYFEAMEKRNVLSWTNRMQVVYYQYCYKGAANSSMTWAAGKWATVQPPPQFTDMSDFNVGGTLGQPQGYLLQEYLDYAAVVLNQEGAPDGDVNDWINLSESGPVYPLYIGQEASNKILLDNPELRSDFNASFMGLKEMNPVLMRMGATRVIKNFRHIIDLFPPRYAYVPYGTTINLCSTGSNSTTGVTATYNNTVGQGASIAGLGPTPVLNTDVWVRIPDHTNSQASIDVTLGYASVVNGCWMDSTVTVTGGSSVNVMQMETCAVLNPLVLTEHVLLPVNSMPGMTLHPQNYMGEWRFVTGNDAFIGINGCAGITDPLHKQGRHFGEYRHAMEPVHPIFGRVIGYRRCANSFNVLACS